MIRRAWRRIIRDPRYQFAHDFLTPPGYAGSKLTLKKLLNLYRMRYEYQRGAVRLRSLPFKLTVEATNVCNLRCPACFTGAGEVGRVRSMMTLELYRKLLHELGDYLFEVEFYNWGEPLLSKFIYTMIEEAHTRGIHTTISTNFSIPFDAERAERLVASGLTVLGVSIDGARQDTYEQYRVRGDLETVLRNCRLVLDAKRKLQVNTPRLVWEFHVFPHNVGDVELARGMAKDLEMDFALAKGWVVGPDWDPEDKWKFYQDPYPARCNFLWQQAVVHNDGSVAPCCGTFYREDDMGQIVVKPEEVGATTFREIWNGSRFLDARRLFRARRGSADLQKTICFNCPSTIVWDNWKNHLAAGKTLDTFRVGYTLNDCFNFFFNHRPARATTARPTRPPAQSDAPAART
jgi:Radical SAM superfamily/Iron-sulfur cluster-binding domain